MSARRCALVLLLGLAAAGAGAVERVEVQALFKNRAVLLVDGRRRVLGAGETSPEGVTLLRADSRAAHVRVGGEERRLTLGNRIGASFKSPRSQRARITADEQGMFLADGSINGQAVRFVLDTGSTLVSLSEPLARQLGLDYRNGREGESQTAAGVVRIWRIELATVTLGDIVLHRVEAAVHEGDFPATALLGNSFLGRVEMQRKGRAVELSRQF